MIKPVKQAKKTILSLAEEEKPIARGWFALLPTVLADELIDAREAIKSGSSTASVKGLWRAAKKEYPKEVSCSLSAFRTWFNGGE